MTETTTYGVLAYRMQPPERCGWRWSMEPPTVSLRTTFHPVLAPNRVQRFLQRVLLGIHWDHPDHDGITVVVPPQAAPEVAGDLREDSKENE